MTPAGSRELIWDCPVDAGRKKPFSFGVAELGLLVAMSPPYWKGLSAPGERRSTCGKAETRRESGGRVVMVQNLVFSARCQDPGPHSNFSALMGSLIMHGILRTNQFLNQFLKQVGFLLIANKKVRPLPKNIFTTKQFRQRHLNVKSTRTSLGERRATSLCSLLRPPGYAQDLAPGRFSGNIL